VHWLLESPAGPGALQQVAIPERLLVFVNRRGECGVAWDLVLIAAGEGRGTGPVGTNTAMDWG
jgi:hypothetical protein